MASVRSRFRFRLSFPPTPLAAAVLALAGAARAKDAPPLQVVQPVQPVQPVQTVQVTARSISETAGVTGFAQPLARTPISADVIDAQVLKDLGAASLSDLARIDASLTDSYNAVGYWTTFAVRGFQVDNRTNFRRDGLPINAETVLSTDNKSAIEVLKGLSGTQAGTSAPGGLVNLVVKRPDQDLRDVAVTWVQPGQVGVAADLSQRFGAGRQFGARLNLSADRLDANARDARGHASSASLAADWRPDARHLLELEFEHNLQSQPSVPAFSMLGPVVPNPHAIDPHINLNDQPWSLPVVTQGNTMSLRYAQALNAQWRVELQALQQRLVSNDHLAFAYGYDGCDVCDRFGADGTYALYDFRSDDERRLTRDLDVSLSGEFDTGPLKHALTVGTLMTRFTARFNDEAYNYVGIGNIAGTAFVPPDPRLLVPNTNRSERNDELYLRDTVQLAENWTAWLGVRHTSLRRASAETSTGSPAFDTDYRQAFTTPFLSLSHQLTEADMVYASWGKGVESTLSPTHGNATNKGQSLPATLSRQWELGWKHASGVDSWGLAAYDVKQAYSGDVQVGANGDTPIYDFQHDGITHSRGLEAEAQTRLGAFTLRASAMLQRVTREQATVASDDGLRPTNIPDSSVKLLASYAVAQVQGLSVQANLAFEGQREVLPDNTAQIPGWTRFDLGTRYAQPLGATTLVWRAGVDNVFDRRAWREAPYQYDHAYLFPLAPRTFHASVEAKF
jgi:iron complex outermembrane receptor protein